jgi:hypothetical protein
VLLEQDLGQKLRTSFVNSWKDFFILRDPTNGRITIKMESKNWHPHCLEINSVVCCFRKVHLQALASLQVQEERLLLKWLNL